MLYLNNELLTVEGIIVAFGKDVPLEGGPVVAPKSKNPLVSAEPKATKNKKDAKVTKSYKNYFAS